MVIFGIKLHTFLGVGGGRALFTFKKLDLACFEQLLYVVNLDQLVELRVRPITVLFRLYWLR
jgi:hypothetical protein